MRNLDGKVAIVTGAASGIGLAIARDLARHGARVAVCDVAESAAAVAAIKADAGAVAAAGSVAKMAALPIWQI